MEWLLAAVAIVLTTAVVVSSLFGHGGTGRPPAATGPPATGAPASTGGAGGGRSGNLVADPGFEAGLAGWRPIGGAPVGRASPARAGRWAAGFTASGAADQGMALTGVLRCVPGRSYAATVWARAGRTGALLQVNLLEVVGGRRFAVDTVGAVLADRRWQRLEVAHDAHQPGASLVLELLVPRGSPRATILVDDLEVVTRKDHVLSGG